MTLQELDALIAEKVMGYKFPKSRCRVCGWPLSKLITRGCVKDNCSRRPVPTKRADSPADYSRSILTAWFVVEQMRSQGWQFSMHDTEPWTAVFSRGGEADEVYSGFATTPALAICEAALKAVGVEISA